MESNSLYRSFFIIVSSAIVHSLILFMFIGAPMPMFSSSRDPETLQFSIEQKIEPGFAVAEKSDFKQPAEVAPMPEKPIHMRAIRHAVASRPVPAAEPAKAKVVDMKYEEAKTPPTPEPTPAVAAEPSQEAPVTKQEQLTPVQDKVAGVQSADSDTDEVTEATSPEANPAPPAEIAPAASVVDKAETPQDQ